VTSIRSLAVQHTAPRPIAPEDVAAGCQWRGVCEDPGATPAEMATRTGKVALEAAEANQRDVGWVIHAGVGPQGSQGWPVHHHIQNGIVGSHGNAVELKQNCAGGLTSWVVAGSLIDDTSYAICTGADNWSWCDRLLNTRTVGGEPFSDVASAAVIAAGGGFAEVLGSGTASCPAQADDWRIHERFWDNTNATDFHRAYTRATTGRSLQALRESVRMFGTAAGKALAEARISRSYVTHFVPQVSDSGQPFEALADKYGLPWSKELQEHHLDHGYLGVSTHAEGLAFLAQTGSLRRDSIVLLLAAEYELSATAIVLRIFRPPRVLEHGMAQVLL
jgi:3-oxoacyl-[acyl-carrier-protein] synthase III